MTTPFVDYLADVVLLLLALRGVVAIIWGDAVPWWPANRKRRSHDH